MTRKHKHKITDGDALGATLRLTRYNERWGIVMSRGLLWAALAVGLTACAPSLDAVNERGGIIGNHGWSQKQSFQKADAACQKFGRHAVVTGTNDWEATLTFACVE